MSGIMVALARRARAYSQPLAMCASFYGVKLPIERLSFRARRMPLPPLVPLVGGSVGGAGGAQREGKYSLMNG